jgi:ATP-dependent exoDNAse (exonuclease V) alpha subunit
MPIIARMNKKLYEISNNETFVITDINKDFIEIKEGSRYINIPVQEFQNLFYLAFAITCHKSQGATFDHPYTIHEWHLYDDSLKYVALSRATKIDYINVV